MSDSDATHLHKICRLCLSQTTACLSLVDNFEVSTMLEALTTIKISPTDEISTMMCATCHSELRLAFSIQQKFLKAEKRFRDRQISSVLKEEGDIKVSVGEEFDPEDDVLLECIVVEVTEEQDDEVREDLSPEDEDYLKKSVLVGIREEQKAEVVEDLDPEYITQKTEGHDNEKTKSATTQEFTCECGEVRTSAGRLYLHKYRCHTRVRCEVCSKQMSPIMLKDHMELHRNKGEIVGASSPPKRLACHICDKIAFSRKTLLQHVKLAHTTRKCAVCGEEMRAASYYKHVEAHRADGYICEICGKSKLSKTALLQHKSVAHNKVACPICRKQMVRLSLKNHLELHKTETAEAEGRTYKCDVCDKTFSTKAYYAKHKYDHEQGTCPVCGKVMGRLSLTKHLKFHNKTYVECETCGKAVSTVGMRQHVKSMHGDNEFKCEYCDVVYKTKKAAMAHQKREHTGVADVACEICDKKFFQKESLKRHVEVDHQGLRPFACGVCGREFYKDFQRAAHMRTHTDEKGYKCKVCAAAFAKRASLWQHLKVEHGATRKFVCAVCGKAFMFRYLLSKHSKVHAK